MRTSRCSGCSLYVRPRSISIVSPTDRFSTGLVADAGNAQVQVSDEEVIDMALRILAQRLSQSSPLDHPRATRQYLAVRFAGLEHEVFTCLYLDNHRRVIACEDLFRGTINVAIVHPREVVKQALAHNAAAIILAHNHPSGVAEPSQADELITHRLREALALIDIKVLDHLIVGGGFTESMAERGLL